MEDTKRPLMFQQLAHEHLLAHAPQSDIERYELRIELMRRTLKGAATNATCCKACQMGNQIAREALERDERVMVGRRVTEFED